MDKCRAERERKEAVGALHSLQEFTGPEGSCLLEPSCSTRTDFRFYPLGCGGTWVNSDPNLEKFFSRAARREPKAAVRALRGDSDIGLEEHTPGRQWLCRQTSVLSGTPGENSQGMPSTKPDRAPGQAQFTLRATLVAAPDQDLIIYSTDIWRIVSDVTALCFSLRSDV